MKLICKNRRATHEYHIYETLECGIVLVGTEVKSLCKGLVSLDEAYATIQNGEIWLINSDIQEYDMERQVKHKPKRERKLLLHKREIEKFAEKNSAKGFTLIPLQMYFKDSKVKVELAICKGKKLYDKRSAEKAKEAKKEMKFR